MHTFRYQLDPIFAINYSVSDLNITGIMAPNTRNIADVIEIPVNTTHVQYSSNWAGAVIISSGITSVTGTFIVPSDKSDSSSGSSASAWVGIDGDTCGSGQLDWT